jgi:putative two-component system response regulator
MLDTADYESAGAGTVQEAREALVKDRFDLVVCDLMMPGEDGLKLVEEIHAAEDETAVLLATVVDSLEIAHKATVFGANGYLVKPFTVNELLINVDHALHESRSREASIEAGRQQDQRVADVRAAMTRLERAAGATDRQAAELLGPLSEAVGRRDLETGAHIRRMGESSALLAAANGMTRDEVESIRLTAPMHDLGKVAIPDSVLLKPAKLTPEERALAERHAQIGHDIFSGSSSLLLALAAEIALTHHERVDGTGYPNGLKGDDIPISGRIVAVTDVYDAVTSDRPYRKALSAEEAMEIMVAGRGTHFDARLLDLFLERLDAVRALASEFADTD